MWAIRWHFKSNQKLFQKDHKRQDFSSFTFSNVLSILIVIGIVLIKCCQLAMSARRQMQTNRLIIGFHMLCECRPYSCFGCFASSPPQLTYIIYQSHWIGRYNERNEEKKKLNKIMDSQDGVFSSHVQCTRYSRP